MPSKYKLGPPHGRICAAPGCNTPARGRYSAHCGPHDTANRRHGHPLQEGITKRDLLPYLKQVREILARNDVADRRDKVKLDAIDARWEIVVANARALLTSTGAVVGWDLKAAQHVVRVAETVKAREVWETVVAVYLLRRARPTLFRSDDAFVYQLQRRVRALATVTMATYYDHQTGKKKVVHRDIPPRTIWRFGDWVQQALGPVGIHFCHVLDREEETKRKAAQDFKATLEAIQ